MRQINSDNYSNKTTFELNLIIHLYINERTFIRLWSVSSIWHVFHYRLINFFIFFYCVLVLERDEKSVKSRFRLTYFCKATALKFVFSLTLQLTHTLDAVLCDGDSRPPRSFLIKRTRDIFAIRFHLHLQLQRKLLRGK